MEGPTILDMNKYPFFVCECGLFKSISTWGGSWETTNVNGIGDYVSLIEIDHGGWYSKLRYWRCQTRISWNIHDKVMEDVVQSNQTWWRMCTLHLDMMVYLVK